jgi:prolyl-tRNA synthetase
VIEATGVAAGFVGPVGLSIPVFADHELRGARGAVCGAGAADAHLVGVDLERDVPNAQFAAQRMAEPGDRCPRCGTGTFRGFKGIEVGHVFFLGTKYSAPMQCNFVDEAGATRPMVMGCYGIGITRVAAAAIEQNHDASGICWPISIAPYEIEVIALQAGDAAVMAAAEAIYEGLKAKGIEVLFDDRDERPGGKFKDADLIGVPLRVAIGGRSLKDGKVELKGRRDKDPTLIPVDGAVEHLAGLVAAEYAKLGGKA